MKQIETIKRGKNYSAVSVGKMDEIIEHVLPMGPEMTIQGKVFAGQAVGATGSEFSFQTLVPGQDSGFLHTHNEGRGTVSGRWRDLPRQRGHRHPRGSRWQACAEEYRQRESDDALHSVQGQCLHRSRQPHDRRRHPK